MGGLPGMVVQCRAHAAWNQYLHELLLKHELPPHVRLEPGCIIAQARQVVVQHVLEVLV